MDKIPSKDLIAAGLDIMARNGRPLTKLPARGRALIYQTPDQQTVRIRTCNDHALIILAESAAPEASMNIEGTDLLLTVMPEIERTPGPVISFLVPTEVAVQAARSGYRGWLARNPLTKGNNRTRNLWFDHDEGEPGHGFMRQWAEFRLDSLNIRTSDQRVDIERCTATIERKINKKIPQEEETHLRKVGHSRMTRQPPEKLGDVIARARNEIAEAAGVSPENIHISIDLN